MLNRSSAANQKNSSNNLLQYSCFSRHEGGRFAAMQHRQIAHVKVPNKFTEDTKNICLMGGKIFSTKNLLISHENSWWPRAQL
jgi:hypothetical protein